MTKLLLLSLLLSGCATTKTEKTVEGTSRIAMGSGLAAAGLATVVIVAADPGDTDVQAVTGYAFGLAALSGGAALAYFGQTELTEGLGMPDPQATAE